jgi:hypothetical protein
VCVFVAGCLTGHTRTHILLHARMQGQGSRCASSPHKPCVRRCQSGSRCSSRRSRASRCCARCVEAAAAHAPRRSLQTRCIGWRQRTSWCARIQNPLQLTEQLAPTLHSTARGSDSAGAHAQVRRPRTPPERGGRPHCRAARTSASGPIFDKLTDPRHYTGAHRQRFDKNGKGRGRAGRMEVRASDIDIDNFDTGWSKRARGQRAKPTPLFGLIDIDRSAGICSLPPAPRARAVCLP